MTELPAIFRYASRSVNGRFARTAATFFFPTPGSHFIADAGSVLISTGTGNAVTDRIPQSTTTASIMLRFGKTDRNSDKNRVRTHLPPEREITGDFDADITEHRTNGIDPLEHRQIEILPHKFLETLNRRSYFPRVLFV